MVTPARQGSGERPPGWAVTIATSRTLRAGLAAAASFALGAGALAASADGRLAPLAVAAAAALAVVAPWRVARAREQGLGPTAPLAELAAALSGLALAGLGAGLASSAGALALAYLALWTAALAGWTAALGRVGQPAVTLAALAALALPYGAQPLLVPLLGPERALELVLRAPLPVLAGSLGELDVIRGGTLYTLLPVGQARPFAYVAPGTALAWAAAAAAAGWALLAARRLTPAPGAPRAGKPLGVAAAALVLLAAPEPAAAQLFPDPTPETAAVGDLVTRVRLGYYLPIVTGSSRVDEGDQKGAKLNYENDLDLDPEFFVPTFEVALTWKNGGRIWIQYMEQVWQGERINEGAFDWDAGFYFPGELLDSRYRFRTIALGGAIDIPIVDYVTLSIITTQRYMKHELRIRGNLSSEKDSFETLIPGLGAAAEVLIWGPIFAYGDIQWLDFRTNLFGTTEERSFKYREWRAGVRFELVEHSFVLVEWYSLQTIVKDDTDRYKQSFDGVRVQVSILF